MQLGTLRGLVYKNMVAFTGADCIVAAVVITCHHETNGVALPCTLWGRNGVVTSGLKWWHSVVTRDGISCGSLHSNGPL